MNANIIKNDSFPGFSFTCDWFNGIYETDNIDSFLMGLVSVDDRLSLSNFYTNNSSLYSYSFKIMLNGMPSISFAWNPDWNSCSDLTQFNIVPQLVNSETGEIFVDNCRVSTLIKSDHNPGLFISISGDGLRFLGDDCVQRLFNYFADHNVRCSRFDLACDIKDKENWVVPMLQDAFSHAQMLYEYDDRVLHSLHHQDSKLSSTLVMRRSFDSSRQLVVDNWQLGNHGSKFGMFRMYDKYFEITHGRHSDRADEMLAGIDYWERLECELHHQYADQCFKFLCESNSIKLAFASAFTAMIRVARARTKGYRLVDLPSDDDYLRFVDWLRENDHFVQFVSEPFIDDSPEKFIKHAWNNASWLYTFFELSQDIPWLMESIMSRGKIQRAKKPGKYSWVNDFIDKYVDEIRARS